MPVRSCTISQFFLYISFMVFCLYGSLLEYWVMIFLEAMFFVLWTFSAYFHGLFQRIRTLWYQATGINKHSDKQPTPSLALFYYHQQVYLSRISTVPCIVFIWDTPDHAMYRCHIRDYKVPIRQIVLVRSLRCRLGGIRQTSREVPRYQPLPRNLAVHGHKPELVKQRRDRTPDVVFEG